MLRALTAFGLVLVACATEAPSEIDDPALPGRTTNPDGIPYPEDALGGAERSATHAGDRIPNFTFKAFVGGDASKGLELVSLADFYDPDQKRHKILDIQVSQSWCSICSAETRATVPGVSALSEEGVVFLQVMTSGPSPASGPSLEDAEGWLARHGMNYTLAVDVRGRRMASLGVTTVPWDILIDTRTMEILDSSAGAPVNVASYVREGLRWVDGHPPSY